MQFHSRPISPAVPSHRVEPNLPASGFRLARTAGSAPAAQLRELLARASRPGVISFAVGLPAQRLLPARDIARAQSRVLPHLTSALQYTVPHAPLKRQIVELMSMRGVTCEVEQVFLTSGSQQGMDLLARLFLDPGDPLMLEETVYDGVRLAVGRHMPRMLTVSTDLETGLDVDGVEAYLKRASVIA